MASWYGPPSFLQLGSWRGSCLDNWSGFASGVGRNGARRKSLVHCFCIAFNSLSGSFFWLQQLGNMYTYYSSSENDERVWKWCPGLTEVTFLPLVFYLERININFNIPNDYQTSNEWKQIGTMELCNEFPISVKMSFR
jgi:hypothetical protein